MNTARMPANLILLRPRGGEAPRPALPPTPGTRPPRLLTRPELLERLETIGTLAPSAPLSFLLVRVSRGRAAARGERADQLLLQAVAKRTGELTRPTDALGRFTASSFGVVLQGAGATAAGATAARLSHHLNQLVASLDANAGVTVYAATGTGLNADALPVAALDSLDDCG